MEGTAAKPADKFYKRLKQGLKVLTNLGFIFEKLERDGNLRTIHACFEAVFDQELSFAIGELSKLQKRSKSFDMRVQLASNTFIFKENLKTVAVAASELSSRANLERQDQGKLHQRHHQASNQEAADERVRRD